MLFGRISTKFWTISDGQVFLPNGISQLTYDTVRKPLENKSFYTNPVYKNSDGKMQSLQDLGKVFVNAQVTGISGGVGQNPQVTYTVNGGPPITIDCRSVIVATTTRSMEFMGMTLPGSTAVNQDVKKAIRNVHTTNSSKMFVRTPTKFWKIVSPPFPTIPQTIQTDELPRGVYTLDYPNTESGVVLISYTWEDDSSKLLALNTLDRYNLFKQIITTICPAWKGCLPEITDPNDTDLINIDWEAESGYYGAFKLNYPGQDVEVQTAYYQFLTANDSTQDTGVYLAGDGVSWSGGWTEGAMHTGLNAACAVIQRLGGTLYPNSPLTQEILYAY
jgi:tryptophan 2-monooxygenase